MQLSLRLGRPHARREVMQIAEDEAVIDRSTVPVGLTGLVRDVERLIDLADARPREVATRLPRRNRRHDRAAWIVEGRPTVDHLDAVPVLVKEPVVETTGRQEVLE